MSGTELKFFGSNGKVKEQEAKEELTKAKKDEDALETVLCHVGQMGLYQWLMFFIMLPFGFILAFVYFVQMFVAATPQRHWCYVPELAHLDQELRRNLSAPGAILGGAWEKCMTYNANWTAVLANLTPPDPGTPMVACQHGWEFELGDIPYHTVVSERGWVCENSGNVPMAQAIFFAGSLVGGILFGWLADRHGRVPAIVGANLIGFVGGAATTFTSGFWDFMAARFVTGMSFDSCMMILYILGLEYVGPKYRTRVANLSIALFFGGGCLILPWVALWAADWRRLLWVTSLPMLLGALVPFCVPESARWLASKGHINKAVDMLRRFEKVNKTQIPQDAMDDFLFQARQTRTTDESFKALLKNPTLRLMMLLLLIVYMTNSLVFDGIVRMSENLGLDFFITFTLTSFTEIPSVALLAFILDMWGRRWVTCGPMIISGALILAAAFVPRGIPVVTLAIIARFAINMAYSTAVQWSAELLPTGLRASGTSLVHASGYVATTLSPFVVYSEHVWQPLPLFILGGFSLIGAGAAAMLAETRGRPMPQTIADGEMLFREYSICGKMEDVESDAWAEKEDHNLNKSVT